MNIENIKELEKIEAEKVKKVMNEIENKVKAILEEIQKIKVKTGNMKLIRTCKMTIGLERNKRNNIRKNIRDCKKNGGGNPAFKTNFKIY